MAKTIVKSILDQLDEKIEGSYYYRGKVIVRFSFLEERIEKFITQYFFGSSLKSVVSANKWDFPEIVLERMTFEAKRTSMKAIVDKLSEKGGFIKTKNNSYPHSKLFEEIRLLNDQRNYFAHYANLIFMKDEFQMDEFVVGLKERRDKNQVRKYTLEEFNALIYRIQKAAHDVNSMVKLLN
jgi:hypothetical protein